LNKFKPALEQTFIKLDRLILKFPEVFQNSEFRKKKLKKK